uniref:Uncharacterized protein n=1 Tax=Toxoplasma gondii COUG TaxID=1074873 RepID=A0A2G8XND9_TOXGO|nr:hypothetical protein TGCOUG_257610 [Toxoplasma gondii COUG]
MEAKVAPRSCELSRGSPRSPPGARRRSASASPKRRLDNQPTCPGPFSSCRSTANGHQVVVAVTERKLPTLSPSSFLPSSSFHLSSLHSPHPSASSPHDLASSRHPFSSPTSSSFSSPSFVLAFCSRAKQAQASAALGEEHLSAASASCITSHRPRGAYVCGETSASAPCVSPTRPSRPKEAPPVISCSSLLSTPASSAWSPASSSASVASPSAPSGLPSPPPPPPAALPPPLTQSAPTARLSSAASSASVVRKPRKTDAGPLPSSVRAGGEQRRATKSERTSPKKACAPSAPRHLPAQVPAPRPPHAPAGRTPHRRRDTDAESAGRLRLLSSTRVFRASPRECRSKRSSFRFPAWPLLWKTPAERRSVPRVLASKKMQDEKNEASPFTSPTSALSSPEALCASGSSPLSPCSSDRSAPLLVQDRPPAVGRKDEGRVKAIDEIPTFRLYAAAPHLPPDLAARSTQCGASAVRPLRDRRPSHLADVCSQNAPVRSPFSRSSNPTTLSVPAASRLNRPRLSPSTCSPHSASSSPASFLSVSASPPTVTGASRLAPRSRVRCDVQSSCGERPHKVRLRVSATAPQRPEVHPAPAVSPQRARAAARTNRLSRVSSGEPLVAWLSRRHDASRRYERLSPLRCSEVPRPSRSPSGARLFQRRASAPSAALNAVYLHQDGFRSLQLAASRRASGTSVGARREAPALGRRDTEGGLRCSLFVAERQGLSRRVSAREGACGGLCALGERRGSERDSSCSAPLWGRQASGWASALERLRQACGEELREDLSRLLEKRGHTSPGMHPFETCWRRVPSCGGRTLSGASVSERRTGSRLREIAEAVASGEFEAWQVEDADNEASDALGSGGVKRALRQTEEKFQGFLCFVVTVGVLLCALAAGIVAGIVMASSTPSPSGALLRVSFALPSVSDTEEPFRQDSRLDSAWRDEADARNSRDTDATQEIGERRNAGQIGQAGRVRNTGQVGRTAESANKKQASQSTTNISISSLNSLVLLLPPASGDTTDVAGVLTGGFVVTLAVHNQGIKTNFSALLELTYLPANDIGQAASSLCFAPEGSDVHLLPEVSEARSSLSLQSSALPGTSKSLRSSAAALRRLSLSTLDSAGPRETPVGCASTEAESLCRAIWESSFSSSFLLPLAISEGSRESHLGRPALRQVVLDATFTRKLKTLLAQKDSANRRPAARGQDASANANTSANSATASSSLPSSARVCSFPPSSSSSLIPAPAGEQMLAVTPWLDWTGFKGGYNEVTVAVNLNRRIGQSEVSLLEALRRDCALFGRVYVAVALKEVIRNSPLQTGDPENWWSLAFRLPCMRVEGTTPPSQAVAGTRTRASLGRHHRAGVSGAQRAVWVSESEGSLPRKKGDWNEGIERETLVARKKGERGGEGEIGEESEERFERAKASREPHARAAETTWPPRLFIYSAVLGDSRASFKAVLTDVLLRWLKRFPTCMHVIQRLAAESGVKVALPTIIH